MEIVGVRFKRAGRVFYYDSNGLDLKVNDEVVAEGEKGQEIGSVVIAPRQVLVNELREPLKPLLRKATDEDLKKKAILQEQAKAALERCRVIACRLGLSMKLFHAEYDLEQRHLVFYFTAEGRVDFRELLKELAPAFRARVELRQVGPRDESKALGSLGLCGRAICCTSFLIGFCPITVRMAKEQALPISAEGLAGACGRLRCCLRFEYEQYRAMNRELPRIGELVATSHGDARVLVGHPLKSTISILLPSGAVVAVPISQVRSLGRAAHAEAFDGQEEQAE